MRAISIMLPVLALSLFSAASQVRSDEVAIALKDVPGKVLNAVKARFPDAELGKAEKETEKGKTRYEIALTHEGTKIEVVSTPEGKIVEIEKEIAVSALPARVAEAIHARFPGARLKKAEEITEFEDGRETREYEVVLVSADKKTREIEVSPSGKIEEEED